MRQTLGPTYSSPNNDINENTRIYKWIHSLPWKQSLRRIPGIFLILLIPWSLYSPFTSPWTFSFYFMFLHIIFVSNNIRSLYGVYIAFKESKLTSLTNWLEKYKKETGVSSGSDLGHDLPFDSISHIIILPNYKENLETLCETLDVLASHSRALTQYKVSIYK